MFYFSLLSHIILKHRDFSNAKKTKKYIKIHPYTRSWSPSCQDVEFCSWLALTFFTNLIPTYLYQHGRKLFPPFGMEIRAFFKKNGKGRYSVGDWGFCNNPAAFIACCYDSFPRHPFRASPSIVVTAVFLLLLSDVLFESSAKCMCAKPSFRNSLFLIRNGVFFHQLVFGFICLNVLWVPVRILLIYLRVTLNGRSVICVTVPAEDAVFVFLFVWLHNWTVHQSFGFGRDCSTSPKLGRWSGGACVCMVMNVCVKEAECACMCVWGVKWGRQLTHHCCLKSGFLKQYWCKPSFFSFFTFSEECCSVCKCIIF